MLEAKTDIYFWGLSGLEIEDHDTPGLEWDTPHRCAV
jgi:hypothetical protein